MERKKEREIKSRSEESVITRDSQLIRECTEKEGEEDTHV